MSVIVVIVVIILIVIALAVGYVFIGSGATMSDDIGDVQGYFIFRSGTEYSTLDTTPVEGGWRLLLQADGNLVINTPEGKTVWHTGTGGNPNAKIVMQSDGNLVIQNTDGFTVWSSSTTGNNTSYAAFDGSTGTFYVDYVESNKVTSLYDPLYKPTSDVIVLQPGTIYNTLAFDKYTFTLKFEPNGDLVIRDTRNTTSNGTVVWSTNTGANIGAILYMQHDGNLVIKNTNGDTVYSSDTHGNPRAYTAFNAVNGKLAIYRAGLYRSSAIPIKTLYAGV